MRWCYQGPRELLGEDVLSSQHHSRWLHSPSPPPLESTQVALSVCAAGEVLDWGLHCEVLWRSEELLVDHFKGGKVTYLVDATVQLRDGPCDRLHVVIGQRPVPEVLNVNVDQLPPPSGTPRGGPVDLELEVVKLHLPRRRDGARLLHHPAGWKDLRQTVL